MLCDVEVVTIADCCWKVFSKSKSASSKYLVYFLAESTLLASGLDGYSTYDLATAVAIGIGTDFALSDVVDSGREP